MHPALAISHALPVPILAGDQDVCVCRSPSVRRFEYRLSPACDSAMIRGSVCRKEPPPCVVAQMPGFPASRRLFRRRQCPPNSNRLRTKPPADERMFPGFRMKVAWPHDAVRFHTALNRRLPHAVHDYHPLGKRRVHRLNPPCQQI
jgi:hypothetical protein